MVRGAFIMAIPRYVLDALEEVMYYGMDLSFDEVLDEMEWVDSAAAEWLEDHEDCYEEALRIAEEG
jgi:hypothetical protein